MAASIFHADHANTYVYGIRLPNFSFALMQVILDGNLHIPLELLTAVIVWGVRPQLGAQAVSTCSSNVMRAARSTTKSICRRKATCKLDADRAVAIQ